MKHYSLKILVLLSISFLLSSCLKFDMEYYMNTHGIPKNVNVSFVDKNGKDLVAELMDNNSDIILNNTTADVRIVNTNYYTQKLFVNGSNIQPEALKIIGPETEIINPITNKVTGYSIDFGWDELFTEELLTSKGWRDFYIEYRVIFPKLFKDDKEHILKFQIKRRNSGTPSLMNSMLDGKPVINSNYVNYCFIVLD